MSARLIFLVAALLTLAPSPCRADGNGQKKVLVVYSTRRETMFPTIADREMPELFEQGLEERPDFYSEYIDGARFPEAQYQSAFADYLRLKYGGVRFDVIVATHRLAYEAVTSLRDDLFPATPIVFLTQDPSVRRVANAAEVIVEPDYRRTVAMAAALQPGTEQVFVISGNSSRDTRTERAARAQFATLGSHLAFTYLSNLATDDLERRLSSLPANAIVFYLLFYQSAEGVNVDPLDYLSRLTAISNRPVYSWTDSTMDHGVIGGSMVSLESQVRVVTRLALRVLRGEPADSIPVEAVDLHVNQVDWRQLQRWHISETRLPAGTLVKFREPGRWERDRTYIFGGLAVLLGETALIAGLILQGVRRRRAEATARESAAALRASYERIRDLGGRLLVAQEAERSRIGRELHDDVSQKLTLLALDLDLLLRSQPDRSDEAQVLSREVHTRVQELAATVHQLSHELHPAKLRIVGLATALGALQREIGHRVTFHSEHVPASLPPETMLCLYRIAQEALQNAIKHSGGGEIAMSLTGGEGTLTLTVSDTGAGFDVGASAARGLGLISMEERLEPLGGTLHIDSTPGHGTRVRAIVPVAEAQVTQAETA